MSEKTARFLRDWWQIIAAALLCAGAWGTNTAQIASLGRGQEAMLATQAKISVDVQAILQTQAGMQVARQFNEAAIKKLEDRMAELERERRR